jgi:hypothetical protein
MFATRYKPLARKLGAVQRACFLEVKENQAKGEAETPLATKSKISVQKEEATAGLADNTTDKFPLWEVVVECWDTRCGHVADLEP